MSEFIKQCIIDYYKGKVDVFLSAEDYWNMQMAKIRTGRPNQAAQLIMLKPRVPYIERLGRRVGNYSALKAYMQIFPQKKIAIVGKSKTKIVDGITPESVFREIYFGKAEKNAEYESVRGGRPPHYLLRDNNGFLIDPDIGILPRDIKEQWKAAWPEFDTSKLQTPVIFGTAGEIPASSWIDRIQTSGREISLQDLENCLTLLARGNKKNRL